MDQQEQSKLETLKDCFVKWEHNEVQGYIDDIPFFFTSKKKLTEKHRNGIYYYVPLNVISDKEERETFRVELANEIKKRYEELEWACFVAAGFVRGRLNISFPKEMHMALHKPNNRELRDELYEAGINPLANFPGEGWVIWGNKIHIPSIEKEFDRIDRFRTFLDVVQCCWNVIEDNLFEKDNEFTREKIKQTLSATLELKCKQKRSIEDFTINHTDHGLYSIWSIPLEPQKLKKLLLDLKGLFKNE
jgi:hypothetical protein